MPKHVKSPYKKQLICSVIIENIPVFLSIIPYEFKINPIPIYLLPNLHHLLSISV